MSAPTIRCAVCGQPLTEADGFIRQTWEKTRWRSTAFHRPCAPPVPRGRRHTILTLPLDSLLRRCAESDPDPAFTKILEEVAK